MDSRGHRDPREFRDPRYGGYRDQRERDIMRKQKHFDPRRPEERGKGK